MGNVLFGASLRKCRKQRNYSQQLVAAGAGISNRHLSFVECNKAGVSRKTLLRIFDVLELSVSQEDMLLQLAGFAASSAASNHLNILGLLPWPIQQVLDMYSPYPAYLLDQHLNILSVNKVSQLYLEYFSVELPLFDGRPNLLLSITQHDSLKRYMFNWEDVVRSMVWRLRLQAQQAADPEPFERLEREVFAADGVRDALRVEPNVHGCKNIFVGSDEMNAEFTHITSSFYASIDEGQSTNYFVESFLPSNGDSIQTFTKYLVDMSCAPEVEKLC